MDTNWGGRFEGVTDTDLERKIETDPPKCLYSFDDMQLKEALLRGIYANGFEKPLTIQQRAITPCIRGRDVIAQAQTGSGKTTTFAISILQQLNTTTDDCQALILAPTRSKALQIRSVISALGSYMNFSMHTCLGGTSLFEDIQCLDMAHQIVVGTPGRICDLILRGYLLTTRLRTLVLGQADEMMSLGLKPKINNVLRALPQDTQVIISATTMPQDVWLMSKYSMHNPIYIELKKNQLSLEAVRQYYVNVKKEEYKLTTLCDLYDTLSISQSVIFCSTRSRVKKLAKDMTGKHFTVATLSRDMDRRVREKIIKHFHLGSYRVLIITDSIARDIDVQQCALIINFDLPNSKGDYVHRIGRSGRCGRKCVAINILTDKDLPTLREIEQLYQTNIEEMPENIADIL